MEMEAFLGTEWLDFLSLETEVCVLLLAALVQGTKMVSEECSSRPV